MSESEQALEHLSKHIQDLMQAIQNDEHIAPWLALSMQEQGNTGNRTNGANEAMPSIVITTTQGMQVALTRNADGITLLNGEPASLEDMGTHTVTLANSHETHTVSTSAYWHTHRGPGEPTLINAGCLLAQRDYCVQQDMAEYALLNHYSQSRVIRLRSRLPCAERNNDGSRCATMTNRAVLTEDLTHRGCYVIRPLCMLHIPTFETEPPIKAQDAMPPLSEVQTPLSQDDSDHSDHSDHSNFQRAMYQSGEEG